MIDDTVTVDVNGNWNYKVPENLAPGTYKITLSGTDINGDEIEKPYTFTVSASASAPSPLPSTGISVQNFLVCIALVFLLLFLLLRSLFFKKTFEERLVN